jgi:hypothetical protein
MRHDQGICPHLKGELKSLSENCEGCFGEGGVPPLGWGETRELPTAWVTLYPHRMGNTSGWRIRFAAEWRRA